MKITVARVDDRRPTVPAEDTQEVELSALLEQRLGDQPYLVAQRVGRTTALLIDTLCTRGVLSTSEALAIVEGDDPHWRILEPHERKDPKPLTSLDLHLDEDLNLDLSVRVWNVLHFAKIRTVRDLVQFSRVDLLQKPKCGPVSVRELEAQLETLGLRLGLNRKEIDFLDLHMAELDLSVRASNLLEALKCKHVADVVALTEASLRVSSGRRVESVIRNINEALRPGGFQLRQP